MGAPRGLARSVRAFADRNPATTAFVAACLKNSLLQIADIHASLCVESEWNMFCRVTALSHGGRTMNKNPGQQGVPEESCQ
jgi:hypothetical protein